MPTARTQPSRRAIEVLLTAGLVALRRGTAGSLTMRHRRLRDAVHSQWLNIIIAAIGDAIPASERASEATRILLHWALEQLRPDGRPGLANIDDHAWLHSTSWRPLLALASHHGLLTIPAFPARYRRRPGEAAVENLCGLWAVGHSTVYRYLDKGRRQLTELFSAGPPAGMHLVSLRHCAERALLSRPEPPEGWPSWHGAQAHQAILAGSVEDGLWHLYRAQDFDGLLATLKRHSSEVAGSCDIEALLAEVEDTCHLPPSQQIELALRRAMLYHCRHDVEHEEDTLSRALRQAEIHGAPLYLGIAQASLGRFFEERDRDRAVAYYEESVDCLRRAIQEGCGADRLRAVNEYASCVVHLAWLHLRRNNPKAKTLLEQIPRISTNLSLDDETVGSLEQTWGEYWRCVGNPRRALEHKHKALTIFERVGDRRSVLSTFNNLSLIYGDAKEYDLAIEYGQRVVSASAGQAVEPELLSSAHCNLGLNYLSLNRLEEAISHYQASRALAEKAGLRSLLVVTNYNLAEAHYERFKQHGDLSDEVLGDECAAVAARLSTEDKAHAQADAARALKREMLGTGEGPDRLLPAEHAAHFAEMAEIERLRLALAVPQPIENQVRTHLAIARTYLAIATKEREAALALADRHGLQADFSAELDALRQTFSRELTREQRLAQDWSERGGDLLASERRQSVLAHVLAQGSINKSAYAEVAAVSLATASKHLGLLAERGLLVQTGKGPSTRYLLADGS